MLDDLRVIDLSNRVSGSYTSKLLASLGAHVIKVEKPSIGDRSRNIGPFLFKSMYKESSLLFRYLNTGKNSITLDIHTISGQKIFQDLISIAEKGGSINLPMEISFQVSSCDEDQTSLNTKIGSYFIF